MPQPVPTPPRKLLGFAPDLDPLTPGVITDGNDFYPTMKGMRTLPDVEQIANPLENACVGAATFQFPDGTEVVVAGTVGTLNSTLSSIMPLAWTTQNISLPASGYWRFTYYHDNATPPVPAIFAANGGPPWIATQASLATAAPWSPLAGSPPNASVMASSDYYLFLVEPRSATWWATVNPTLWTPDVATLTVTNSILQTPGNIVAAKASRSSMILYKQDSMFRGDLVGGAFIGSGIPIIWQFSEISRQVGAPQQEAVASFRDVQYFPGPDDFYSFDGFNLAPIPNAHKEWFFARFQYPGRIEARVDKVRSLIVWHYATIFDAADAPLSEWLAFNVRTGQWARGQRTIEATMDGQFQGSAGFVTPRVVHSGRPLAHVLEAYLPTGIRSVEQRDVPPAFLVTGDLGDRRQMYQLTGVRPGFTNPTGRSDTDLGNGTPTMNVLSSYVSGKGYQQGPDIPLTPDGWFNTLNTARLQRLRFTAEFDVEMTDYAPMIQPAGDR